MPDPGSLTPIRTVDDAVEHLQGNEPGFGGAMLTVFQAMGPDAVLDALGDTGHEAGLVAQRWMRRFRMLEQSQQIWESPEDPEAKAMWLVACAFSQHPDAVSRLQEALRHYEQVGDSTAEALVHYRLADEYLGLGQLDAAERHAQATIALAQRLRIPLAQALGLSALAQRNAAGRDTAVALAQIEESVLSAQEIGPAVEARVLITRAWILELAGQAQKATEDWSRAAQLAVRVGNIRHAHQLAGYVAFAQMQLGELASALASLQRVPSADLSGLVHEAHLQMTGDCLAMLGDLRRAVVAYEGAGVRALENQHQWQALAGWLRARNELGEPCAVDEAVISQALELDHAPALTLLLALSAQGRGPDPATLTPPLQRRGPYLVAVSEGLRSREALNAGDFDVALEISRSALKTAESHTHVVHVHRSQRQILWIQHWMGNGEVAAARMLAEASMKRSDALGEAMDRFLLGMCHLPNNPGLARVELERTNGLCGHHGYRRLHDTAAPWLALFEQPVPGDDVVSITSRLIASPDNGRLVETLEKRLAGLAPSWAQAMRQTLGPVIQQRTGLVCLAPGGTHLLVREGDRALVWDGQAIDLGKSATLRQLVATVAVAEPPADRKTLFETVWQQTYRPPSSDNTLYVTLNRLKKLGIPLEQLPDGGYSLPAGTAIWERRTL